MALYDGDSVDRYNRDFALREDDREARDLDDASDERISRLYCDPVTLVSATGRSV